MTAEIQEALDKVLKNLDCGYNGSVEALALIKKAFIEIEAVKEKAENDLIALSFMKPESITFYEDEGIERHLIWEDGDDSVGILGGYVSDDNIYDDLKEAKEKAERVRDRITREYYNLIDKFSLCDECICNKDKCIDAFCVDLIRAKAEGE